jgi:hypothetical protein
MRKTSPTTFIHNFHFFNFFNMKYLFFCILGMLASCNKEKTKNAVIDTQIDVFIENSVGENRLLSTTINNISPDSIRLQYLINGDKFTVYNSKMDCPTNICAISDIGSERIRIFPNDIESEDYPITYINWGNGDIDTLKCHFVRKGNETNSSIVCDKVWFNDLLMFPDKAVIGFGRAFKIVKQ